MTNPNLRPKQPVAARFSVRTKDRMLTHAATVTGEDELPHANACGYQDGQGLSFRVRKISPRRRNSAHS